MATNKRLRPAGDEFSDIALMYVSVSTIGPLESDGEVANIVARSAKKNAKLGITGALIATGTHFAQVLEGSAGIVDQLMVEIMDDQRHRGVTIVERRQINSRRFAEWSMAYMGGATYVDRPLKQFLTHGGESARLDCVHEIYALMAEFTQR